MKPVVAVVVPSSADEVLVGTVSTDEELTKLLETEVAVKGTHNLEMLENTQSSWFRQHCGWAMLNFQILV